MFSLRRLAGLAMVLLLSLGFAESASAQATFQLVVSPDEQPVAQGETALAV